MFAVRQKKKMKMSSSENFSRHALWAVSITALGQGEEDDWNFRLLEMKQFYNSDNVFLHALRVVSITTLGQRAEDDWYFGLLEMKQFYNSENVFLLNEWPIKTCLQGIIKKHPVHGDG